jgi:glutamine amidotransferase
MCRWLAYTGAPILVEEVLFKPTHSLIDQSMASKSAETPTNGDGFGLGWYGRRPEPGLFRSIRPAWNDANLRDIAAQIETPLMLAHVRATSLATVQETNCHPFRHGRWLFVHNGEIFDIGKFRRDLVLAVDPALFNCIEGTTDSELMFYLALSLGLDQDPVGAMERMAGLVERLGRKAGVSESLWMTLGFSDGERLFAVRYASDGDAPTLYYSRDVADVYRLNPALKAGLPPSTRMVVSEPLGAVAEAWVPVPQATALEVRGDQVVMRPFTPAA